MNVHTKTQKFNCSPEVLIDLLGKEENLAKWATIFCQEVKKQGEDYKITTPMGEMYFKINKDLETGVIDMKAGPTKDQMWGGYHRVVSDNMGGSIFIFTHLQAPDESDESFHAGCQGLDAEFEVIKNLVEKV